MSEEEDFIQTVASRRESFEAKPIEDPVQEANICEPIFEDPVRAISPIEKFERSNCAEVTPEIYKPRRNQFERPRKQQLS